MFETLTAPEVDKIIRLMGMFRDDPREDKVDLGVGVYKTPEGRTPVMRAVKAAEELVWQAQDSKGYVALAGDPEYLAAMRALIFGDAVAALYRRRARHACRFLFESPGYGIQGL